MSWFRESLGSKEPGSGQLGQLCGNGLMMSQVAGGAWEVAL